MTTTDNALLTAEVLRRLDGRLTYRQLDYWAKVGRISPAIADPGGSGNRRMWSEEDVAALTAILDMLDRHRQELEDLSTGAMWDELHRPIIRPRR